MPKKRLPGRQPAAALCLLLCAACGGGRPGPGLQLLLAADPLPGTGCLDAGGQPRASSHFIGQAGTLRLTVVRRDAGGPSFLCDAAARVQKDAPTLDLGAASGALVDLHAELFDPMGVRIASGAAPALSLAPDAAAAALAPAVQLELYPTAKWSCPPAGMKGERAFHSATLLPTGEVLLLGGLGRPQNASLPVFPLQQTVAEVFDPAAGAFRELPVKELAPRAFHQAVVLDAGADAVRILVYGGFIADDAQAIEGAPVALTQLRFSPLRATPAGAALLRYDLRTRQLGVIAPAAEIAALPAAAFAGLAALPGGGALGIGGEGLPAGQPEVAGMTSNLVPNQGAVVFPGPAPGGGGAVVPRAQALAQWLVGPSVTAIGKGTVFVLGSARSLPAQAPAAQLLGLLFTGLPGAGAPQPARSFEFPGEPGTVLHTATLLSPLDAMPAQLLVTGGFVMDAQSAPLQALQPPAADQAVRLYEVSATRAAFTQVPIPREANYRPAGFEAASATVSGRQVLLSGGSPQGVDRNDQKCEDGDNITLKQLCVLHQAARYDADAQKLLPVDALALGRMGHRETLLPDGSILVTGGLYRPRPDQTSASAEAVVYNPRARQSSQMADREDPLFSLKIARQGVAEAQRCDLAE